MGQGQDKIAKTLVELQPTAIIELFLIYFNYKNSPDSFFAFHGGSIFQNPITWQGVEYLPIPVETEGFEVNANGRIARPKIKISNKDYIVTDILNQFEDLQFAKLVRKRTFTKYLDNINFVDGNPWGDPDSSAELSNDTFIVSQKTAENKLFVEFELTSQLDIDGLDLNKRKIFSNYCSFTYRGDGCYYKGRPLTNNKNENISPNPRSLAALENGDPTESFDWIPNFKYLRGDIVVVEDKSHSLYYSPNQFPNNTFNQNDNTYLKYYYVAKGDHVSSLQNGPNSINRDTFWWKDECIKTLNACKKRFNTDVFTKTETGQVIMTDHYLNFQKSNVPMGNYLRLSQHPFLNSFFNTGFYTGDFTIAMWISMSGKPSVTAGRYGLFTNANYLTQQDTEGIHCLNYYLSNQANNLRLVQSHSIKSSSIRTQNLELSTDLAIDNSYQLLIFESNKPREAGGYIQLSLNNQFTGKITLGNGESFTFAEPSYGNYATGLFSICDNNIWKSSSSTFNHITPIKFHGLAIWSRNLNTAEKLWLGRDDTEPNANKEVAEVRAPREITEIPLLHQALKENNLELWMDNGTPSYGSNTQILQAERFKPGQQWDHVTLKITGAPVDLAEFKNNTGKYEYVYSKTPNNWLPFGGYPGTYKFAYGEV